MPPRSHHHPSSSPRARAASRGVVSRLHSEAVAQRQWSAGLLGSAEDNEDPLGEGSRGRESEAVGLDRTVREDSVFQPAQEAEDDELRAQMSDEETLDGNEEEFEDAQETMRQNASRELDADDLLERATAIDDEDKMISIFTEKGGSLDLPVLNQDPETGERVPLSLEDVELRSTTYLDASLVISDIEAPLHAKALDVEIVHLDPLAAGRVVKVKSSEKVFHKGSLQMGLGHDARGNWSAVLQPVTSGAPVELTHEIYNVRDEIKCYLQAGIAYILGHHRSFLGKGVMSFKDAGELKALFEDRKKKGVKPSDYHNWDEVIDLTVKQARELEVAMIELWNDRFDPFLRDEEEPDKQVYKLSFMSQKYGQNIELPSNSKRRKGVLLEFLRFFDPVQRVCQIAIATNFSAIWTGIKREPSVEPDDEDAALDPPLRVALLLNLPLLRPLLQTYTGYRVLFSRRHGNAQSPRVYPCLTQYVADLNNQAEEAWQVEPLLRISTLNAYNEIKDHWRPSPRQFAAGSGVNTAGLAVHNQRDIKQQRVAKRALAGESEKIVSEQIRLVDEHSRFGHRCEVAISLSMLPAERYPHGEDYDHVWNEDERLDTFAYLLTSASYAAEHTVKDWIPYLDAIHPKYFPGLMNAFTYVFYKIIDRVRTHIIATGAETTLGMRETVDWCERLIRRCFTGRPVTPQLGWATWGTAGALKIQGYPYVDLAVFDPLEWKIDLLEWPTNRAGNRLYNHESAILEHFDATFLAHVHLRNETEFLTQANILGMNGMATGPLISELQALFDEFVLTTLSSQLAKSVCDTVYSRTHQRIIEFASYHAATGRSIKGGHRPPNAYTRELKVWANLGIDNGPFTISGARQLFVTYFPEEDPYTLKITRKFREQVIAEAATIAEYNGERLEWAGHDLDDVDNEPDALKDTLDDAALLRRFVADSNLDNSTPYVYAGDLAKELIAQAVPGVAKQSVIANRHSSFAWKPLASWTWMRDLSVLLTAFFKMSGQPASQNTGSTRLPLANAVNLLRNALQNHLAFIPKPKAGGAPGLLHLQWLLVRHDALQLDSGSGRGAFEKVTHRRVTRQRNEEDDEEDEEHHQSVQQAIEDSRTRQFHEECHDTLGFTLPIRGAKYANFFTAFQQDLEHRIQLHHAKPAFQRNKTPRTALQWQHQADALDLTLQIVKSVDITNNTVHQLFLVMACLFSFDAPNLPWIAVRSYDPTAHDPFVEPPARKDGRSDKAIVRASCVVALLAVYEPKWRRALDRGGARFITVFFEYGAERGYNSCLFRYWRVGRYAFLDTQRRFPENMKKGWIPAKEEVLVQRFNKAVVAFSQRRWEEIFRLVWPLNRIKLLGPLPFGY